MPCSTTSTRAGAPVVACAYSASWSAASGPPCCSIAVLVADLPPGASGVARGSSAARSTGSPGAIRSRSRNDAAMVPPAVRPARPGRETSGANG